MKLKTKLTLLLPIVLLSIAFLYSTTSFTNRSEDSSTDSLLDCWLLFPTYCQTLIDDTHLSVVRVKVISNHWTDNAALLERISTISDDNITADTLVILNGISSADIPIYGMPGEEMIINLSNFNLDNELDTFLYESGCGISQISILNDSLQLSAHPCTPILSFQDFLDNYQNCLDFKPFILSGTIQTWNPIDYNFSNLQVSPLEETIELDDNNTFGCYAFSPEDLNEEGLSYYQLTPSIPDSNLTFQITAKDLILLQRAILNIENFEYPEQYIAADVNNNQMLDLSDLILIRKAILGLIDEFPDVPNWQLIRSNCNINLEQPWPSSSCFYHEEHYENTQEETFIHPHLDFTAIKMGDISGDL